MTEQRVSDERLATVIHRISTHRAEAALVCLDAALDLRDSRAEAARLRAVLIEAQECIDYGTRAGGAAEVLAHIATVLKEYISENWLREAEVQGDESWQARRAELLDDLVIPVVLTVKGRELVAAALDRAFEFGREGRT